MIIEWAATPGKQSVKFKKSWLLPNVFCFGPLPPLIASYCRLLLLVKPVRRACACARGSKFGQDASLTRHTCSSPCPFKKFTEDLSVRVIVWSIICQRTSLQSFTLKKQHKITPRATPFLNKFFYHFLL